MCKMTLFLSPVLDKILNTNGLDAKFGDGKPICAVVGKNVILHDTKRFYLVSKMLDTLMFWDKNHCMKMYLKYYFDIIV